jgi:nicotinate-nucleotide adenylyltransferase
MSYTPLHTVTRLGVLGGTFDPIHYGHLVLAETARIHYALDAVLFIPAGEPPHKTSQQATAEERFLMVSLATASHPLFHVSRIEIERAGASYTVDTLRTLRGLFPCAALFLLLGADSALDFPLWRAPEEISQLATIVAATRPGVALDPSARAAAGEGVHYEVLPIPGLLLSSSDLRARVHEGLSLRYLTPDAVVAFIEKSGLYR